jgi:mannose-6-phosphate isomerase-like protein (cupin superfamily)
VNDSYLKVVKVKGEFVWHYYDNEDELFLVIKGNLTIKLRDRELHIAEGKFAVIPKGVEHMPVAGKEVQMLLLEPKTTLNASDVETERTVANPDRI